MISRRKENDTEKKTPEVERDKHAKKS